MKIIQEGGRYSTQAYERVFYYEGHIGSWGFAFPCDAAGNIDQAQMTDSSRASLAKCLEGCDGKTKIVDGGVEHRTYYHRQQRLGKCDCGRIVELDRFTCPCECGRDYNSSGQLLAPREQWGEETGECWADIINY